MSSAVEQRLVEGRSAASNCATSIPLSGQRCSHVGFPRSEPGRAKHTSPTDGAPGWASVFLPEKTSLEGCRRGHRLSGRSLSRSRAGPMRIFWPPSRNGLGPSPFLRLPAAKMPPKPACLRGRRAISEALPTEKVTGSHRNRRADFAGHRRWTKPPPASVPTVATTSERGEDLSAR
jgi:hypothetical protein